MKTEQINTSMFLKKICIRGIINKTCSQLKQKEGKKSMRKNEIKKLYFNSIKQIKIVSAKCLF